jgi:hypothetical protein
MERTLSPNLVADPACGREAEQFEDIGNPDIGPQSPEVDARHRRLSRNREEEPVTDKVSRKRIPNTTRATWKPFFIPPRSQKACA